MCTVIAERLERFLLGITSVPWDSAAARAYASLAAAASKKGKRLSGMDLLIARHAHSLGLTLVTADGSFSSLRASIALADWSNS